MSRHVLGVDSDDKTDDVCDAHTAEIVVVFYCSFLFDGAYQHNATLPIMPVVTFTR